MTNTELDFEKILNEAIDDFEKLHEAGGDPCEPTIKTTSCKPPNGAADDEDVYYLVSINNRPVFFHKEQEKCHKKIQDMIKNLMDTLDDDTYVDYYVKHEYKSNTIEVIKKLDFIIFVYNLPVYTFIINEIYNID